ncbi:MAG: aldo/keto reductase, partial [Ignavibacteriaceae bacterium]|nr:aldo/keto reductase [Ignavibacteriaceae bacterium]
DYIDLYLIHAADFVTPLEETLSALNDLVRNGKVRYIGCSNFYGWQLVKANAISEKNGWEKLIVNQIYYSLLGREAEYEMIPAAIEEGIANTIWSPLHGGILSGKYFDKKNWPKDTRIKEPGAHFPYDVVQGEEVMRTVIRIAKVNNVSPAQVSLNYLLKKKGVSSLVIGAKNKEQLLDNLNTVKWELTKEQFDELDKLSAPKNVYPHWYYNFFRKAELEKGSHL